MCSEKIYYFYSREKLSFESVCFMKIGINGSKFSAQNLIQQQSLQSASDALTRLFVESLE